MAKGKFSSPRNPRRNDPEPTPAPQEPELSHEALLDTELGIHPELGLELEFESMGAVAPEVPEESTPEPQPVEEVPAADPVEVFSPEAPFAEDLAPVEPEVSASQEQPGESGEPGPVTSPTIEKNKKIMIISLCSVALVLLIALVIGGSFLLNAANDDGLILNNVTVAGVNLGGMTQEEAVAALALATKDSYTAKEMVISLPEATITLPPAHTGAKLDVEAAVKAAYKYGRTGSRAEREAARAQSLVGAHHIPLLPYLQLNTEYIQDVLNKYCATVNSGYSPASYTVEGDMPALSGDRFDPEAPCQTLMFFTGIPGRNLDADTLYTQVLDAYSLNTFLVEITESDLDKMPEPLDLQAVLVAVCREPSNAAVDNLTKAVIPEVYGYTFNVERAQALLSEAEPGDTIAVPMEYVTPELTTEGLFKDVLGAFKTEHTNNKNRNTNIELACAAINNLILLPGETFDFNQVVGKRTAEAGYKPAPAYVGSKTQNELGGGICQVSSTLYYCTLIADLEIVTRRAHGFISSYMPYGMDATVSWGGPDFRFRNNTNNPIRIEAYMADGYVHISLMGIDEKDYYVEMEYKVIGFFEYETEYEEFPVDNEEGYKDGDVVQTPYNGYTVDTYKLRYDKATGQLLSRDFEARSIYSVRNMILAKVPTETEPSDPTDSTDPSEPSEPSSEPPAETDPPVTDPPATDPPATDPPVTDPPATDPPVTDPPSTQPQATEPPAPPADEAA